MSTIHFFEIKHVIRGLVLLYSVYSMVFLVLFNKVSIKNKPLIGSKNKLYLHEVYLYFVVYCSMIYNKTYNFDELHASKEKNRIEDAQKVRNVPNIYSAYFF